MAEAPTHPLSQAVDRGGASPPEFEKDRPEERRSATRTAALFERRVLPQPRPRVQFVGWIAAKRNEVGYLFWIDAISLPDLFRTDASNFAASLATAA
jgi:hypothetical protein